MTKVIPKIISPMSLPTSYLACQTSANEPMLKFCHLYWRLPMTEVWRVIIPCQCHTDNHRKLPKSQESIERNDKILKILAKSCRCSPIIRTSKIRLLWSFESYVEQGHTRKVFIQKMTCFPTTPPLCVLGKNHWNAKHWIFVVLLVTFN